MSMFKVSQGEPAFDTDSDGWDHHAWTYLLEGIESGVTLRGTYRAGTGIDPASVTGGDILESVARDIETATDHWTAEPTVRSLIEQLSTELGYDDPVAAYDTATVLVRACEWSDRLTTGEREELESITEEEDA